MAAGGLAAVLTDLQLPPSHRLKALRGDRQGQYSIYINHQWCGVLLWTDRDGKRS